MSRGLTAGMVTEVAAATLHPVLLIELQFDSGTLRFWTGFGDLVWDGRTWTGGGQFLNIGAVSEASEAKAMGATATLSGMPSALVAIAQTEPYQGRPAVIYFAVLDATGAPVADPYVAMRARMDTITDEDDGRTATFTLSLENVLIDLEGAAERRYTPEDQLLDFPEELSSPYTRDRMFDMVTALQDLEIVLE